MKKIILLGVAALTLSSCQQQAKIGFVDNSKLINEYQEKKDIEERLQSKINGFQKRTDSLQQAFQLEINEAEIKARSMSQAGVQKLMKEFQDKETALSQRVQFERNAIAQESQAQNDSLLKRVKDFVKDYGQKNGYEYILGSNEAGSVIYGNEKHDLTEIILEALNAEYKNQ